MAPLALLDPPLTTTADLPALTQQAIVQGTPAEAWRFTGAAPNVAESLASRTRASARIVSEDVPASLPRTTGTEGDARSVRVGPHPRILDDAVAALQPVALEPESTPSERAMAARLLRSAALERRLLAPRVAGVAVLLSDALTFTSLSEGVSGSQREALKVGLRLLTEPFISTGEEGDFVDALLNSGWDIVAPLDFGELAELDVAEGD